MPVHALVFDLDGTLVNTAPDLLAATNHVLALDGLAPLEAAQMNNFVGHGAKALLMRGFTARGRTLEGEALEENIRQWRALRALQTRVAMEKMVNHEFLGDGHSVQRTTFGDGTAVTVNFRENTYSIAYPKA